MRVWIPIGALWWLGLYAAFGVLVPWLLRWTRKGRNGLETSPRKLYRRGELGLFGLLLAISAVLDLRKSGLPTQLILTNAVILIFSGLMAASAWLEDYSRVSQGLANPDHRTWVDSRKLLFLVLSVAFTTEVLLEHTAEVWQR
ncbi:MAG: hypothetical protein ACLPVW_17230 [Terriglobales bacterium]